MKCLLIYLAAFLINDHIQTVRGGTSKFAKAKKALGRQGNGTTAAIDNDNVTISQNENSCSIGEVSHVIIDGFSSCCATNVTLTHGIDIGKYWKECAVQLKKTNSSKGVTDADAKTETYIKATRRVYSCILSKYSRKETVSLTTFADLMTINYPMDIRNRIMNDVKKQIKANEGVQLSDYERVRKIRIQYFEIQKNVCISIDSNPNKEPIPAFSSNGTSRTCDQSEEAGIIGGSCCKKESVPIDLDFWSSRPLKQDQCNATLKLEFKTWKVEDHELDSALEICSEACALKQEKVLGYHELNNYQISKNFNQKAFHEEIKRIAPKYLSQNMIDVIIKYSEKHFNLTIAEKEISKYHHMPVERIATFRSCIIYHRIVDIIYDALHAHCFPTETDTDHPIQQLVDHY